MEYDKREYAQVFDVQRFSVHDGEGIRTTVFFKGCPLRCQWCHNPEGIGFNQRLVYSKPKCIQCRLCIEASNKAIAFDDDNTIAIDYNVAFDLKKVEDVCPTGALKRDSKIWHIDDLIYQVLKDKAFYKYGGGVTASGGEPLMQSEFLENFFRRLKEKNVHTAIETALYVPPENVERVIKYVDTIFFDLKIMDSEMHKKYVGTDNKKILDNAKYILNSHYAERVTVRTPIIPGITDSDENIAQIASFIVKNYKDVKYELMNYNSLAPAKYEKIGQEYLLKELKPLTTVELERLLQIAEDMGVKNIVNERMK